MRRHTRHQLSCICEILKHCHSATAKCHYRSNNQLAFRLFITYKELYFVKNSFNKLSSASTFPATSVS